MTHSLSSRLFAWLELCRVSNLPTVWTNVLTGCAVAAGFGMNVAKPDGNPWEFSPPWRLIVLMAGAMSLFYVAGMALNDLLDADVDAMERPRRPIPSGRVGKGAALYFILACFFTGLFALWWFLPQSLLFAVPLLLAIIAYDALHKRFAGSVLLMGLCRSLVVLTAASATTETAHLETVGLPLALALGTYVIGITIIARGEVEDRIDGRRWLALLMPLVVLSMVGVVRPALWHWAAVAAFFFCLWMAQAIRAVFDRPPKTIKAVLTWLSGICLVDAYFLALLGAPVLAAIAGACFALTVWGHRKILGT